MGRDRANRGGSRLDTKGSCLRGNQGKTEEIFGEEGGGVSGGAVGEVIDRDVGVISGGDVGGVSITPVAESGLMCKYFGENPINSFQQMKVIWAYMMLKLTWAKPNKGDLEQS